MSMTLQQFIWGVVLACIGGIVCMVIFGIAGWAGRTSSRGPHAP